MLKNLPVWKINQPFQFFSRKSPLCSILQFNLIISI